MVASSHSSLSPVFFTVDSIHLNSMTSWPISNCCQPLQCLKNQHIKGRLAPPSLPLISLRSVHPSLYIHLFPLFSSSHILLFYIHLPPCVSHFQALFLLSCFVIIEYLLPSFVISFSRAFYHPFLNVLEEFLSSFLLSSRTFSPFVVSPSCTSHSLSYLHLVMCLTLSDIL